MASEFSPVTCAGESCLLFHSKKRYKNERGLSTQNPAGCESSSWARAPFPPPQPEASALRPLQRGQTDFTTDINWANM